ncbi:MAG: hypothetical protein K2K47_08095 [Duncaniella sp.]|nr:hypothetical protein [Duncaniella sp.]
MIDIINNTLQILKYDSEWQDRYEGYLLDIWSNSDKITKGFTKPQGLSVYTTVADRNNRNYYLRFKGQNVGKVIVDRNGKVTLKCLVEESTSHNIKGCPLKNGKVAYWDSTEATQFRAFFKSLSLETKTKSPEHEVENALLKEFRKRIGVNKALRYIQPVLLHGNFFQMPTPLKASTHIPTYATSRGGGIDMLARIKSSEKGHTRLCVIEIKDENIDKESQKAAMSQAITYATFIAELLTRQPDWMEFFMGHKTKLNRNSKCLDKFDIEVITIMPEGNTETFQDEKLEIPGTNFILHCHSLFYNKHKFEETHEFEFSGTFLKEIKQ